jgi:multicomponent Na+:H+ antiporter subunit C
VEGVTAYSSPLPHVLILTAIVVGVATTAVGLALAVRIHEAYDSVEEDQIHAEDIAADEALMDAETTGREDGRR